MKSTTTVEIKLKDATKAPIPANTECEILFNRGERLCTVTVPGRDTFKTKCVNLPYFFAKDFTKPTLDELQAWSDDGICESVTGDRVEPDGWGPDGAPSWLLAMGMI